MEGHTTSVWCGTAVIPDLVRSGRTKRGSDVRQAEDKFSCQDMNKTHRKRKTAKLEARKESRQLPNRHPEHGGNKMESAGVCARCRIWKGGSVTVNEASNGAGLAAMPAGSPHGLWNSVRTDTHEPGSLLIYGGLQPRGSRIPYPSSWSDLCFVSLVTVGQKQP
jgi:hypothetical protein